MTKNRGPGKSARKGDLPDRTRQHVSGRVDRRTLVRENPVGGRNLLQPFPVGQFALAANRKANRI